MNKLPFTSAGDTSKFNEVPEIPETSKVNVEIADARDTGPTCEQIVKRKPCLIRARFAGSGKSYM